MVSAPKDKEMASMVSRVICRLMPFEVMNSMYPKALSPSWCRALHPEAKGNVLKCCTRPKGHPGPHVDHYREYTPEFLYWENESDAQK